MQLSDFDYQLPEWLIAQHPAPERDSSRLLQLVGGQLFHSAFTDLKDILKPGDLLVLNDTRVVKARLQAVKDSGGTAEILLEKVLVTSVDASAVESDEALCQVRVSKPLKAGRKLLVHDAVIECLGRQGEFYHLRFPQPVFDFLQTFGELPLPPYIRRSGETADQSPDEARYQTVFARHPGAVAAPTAGLHFSEAFLSQLQQQGVDSACVTLHVGAGTFQPVRKENLSDHVMHEEHYQIQSDAVEKIRQTKALSLIHI